MNPKVENIISEATEVVPVALCQVWTKPWDVDGNVERTLEALDEAASRGAQLAITPECVFHGYGFGTTQDETLRRTGEIAEKLDGPHLSAVRDLAKHRSMGIVLGFVEQGENGALHNSAACISSHGEILSIYRKVHCRTFESVHFDGAFTPGDAFGAVDVTCGASTFRLGTMICFDREIPESVRCLRALGSQLIACPLATVTDPLEEAVNYANNEMVTRVRAAENEVFIAVVNHSGASNGGSFVVGPGGEALIQLGAEPEVAVIDLPLSPLRDRIQSQAHGWMGWGYRRGEVYAKQLDRERNP